MPDLALVYLLGTFLPSLSSSYLLGLELARILYLLIRINPCPRSNLDSLSYQAT